MNSATETHGYLNGFYRPGLSSLERLSSTTVGQRNTLDGLLKQLKREASQKTSKHFIIQGPPGIGKTHFLKILGESIHQSSSLEQLYTVVQFPVDNHRILTFADLILRIIKILGDSTNDHFWRVLHLQLEENSEDNKITSGILPRIEQYYKKTGRRLLIIFENLDDFLKGTIRSEKSIREFKKYLKGSKSVAFIGSSSAYSAETEIPKHLLGDLFVTMELKEFSEKQTIELIRKNLEWDNQQDLLNIFDELVPKIQALHTLSGGNPRLSLILYELIAKENNLDIKKQFERLLDQISPFFRERINRFSAQERAILATLAVMRSDHNTPTIIARKLRISAQQSSVLLNKMAEAGHVLTTNHPTDKRSKIFTIKEGLFDLWLAMGQLKEPKRFLPLLVEFLEKWYAEKKGRVRKRRQLWQSLRSYSSINPVSDIESVEQLLGYLADIGTNEEKVQNNLELTFHFCKKGKKEAGKALVDKICKLPGRQPFHNWMIRQFQLWLADSPESAALPLIEGIVDCWTHLRSGELDMMMTLALKLSDDFTQTGQHELSISLLENSFKNLKKISAKVLFLEKIAYCQEKLDHLDNALKTWNQALRITEKANDRKTQGTILNNISQMLQDRGDFDTALAYMHQSLFILEEIDDFDGQGTTLNNISTIHFSQGYYEKSLECLEQALAIAKERENISIEGITLSNISLIYQARDDYEKALEYLERSLDALRKIGNRSGEGTTLHNISQIHMELNNLEKSLEYVEQSLSIMLEIENQPGICFSLFNKGKIFWKKGNRNKAISIWANTYRLASEINLVEVIGQLKKLADSFGENGLEYWREIAIDSES